MAQKRMFDKKITDSDPFGEIPNTTKALYFLAGMNADDRGFFQPKRLQRLYGFSDDEFKILIAKKFFILFESGVMVITDWNKNNYLQKTRIIETEYLEELRLLKIINEKYELNDKTIQLKFNEGLTSVKLEISESTENTNVKPMFNECSESIEENSIEYIDNNDDIEIDNKENNSYSNTIEEKEIKKEKEVFSYFESQFGITISGYNLEIIEEISKTYNDEILCYAIDLCVLYGIKTLAYFCGIIKTWKIKKLKTFDEIKKYQIEYSKSHSREQSEYKELFDYDWLNEGSEINAN